MDIKYLFSGNGVTVVYKNGERILHYCDGDIIVESPNSEKESKKCPHEHIILVEGSSGTYYPTCRDCGKLL